MASASVGSPMTSCHCLTGNCECHDGRVQRVPVVEDVEQVPPLFSIEYRESPVIEDDEVSLVKLARSL